MDRQNLYAAVVGLTEKVVNDPRWAAAKDEIGLNVLGMLLYGYALTVGRVVMVLEIEDVDDVVEKCLVRRVGTGPQWSKGLVAEAKLSAFNPARHLIHYELIGVGQSYASIQDAATIVDNVFANIASIRARMSEDADIDQASGEASAP